MSLIAAVFYPLSGRKVSRPSDWTAARGKK
jgi:hypothetical protein